MGNFYLFYYDFDLYIRERLFFIKKDSEDYITTSIDGHFATYSAKLVSDYTKKQILI